MNRYRITQIRTDIDTAADKLPGIVASRVRIRESDISDWEIMRRSIDSRKKPYIQFVYTVDFHTHRNIRTDRIAGLTRVEDSDIPVPPEHGTEEMLGRPVIAGLGPCGLFAGLELAKEGYRPVILERGPAMGERVESVERFRRDRVLDPEANMLFGEGGAGTFSDGKIGTGIKDPLIRQVLREFRDAGAGEDIMYLAKPHIGTDVLRTVIVNIRRRIIELGGEIRFNTRLDSLVIEDGKLRAVNISRTHDGCCEDAVRQGSLQDRAPSRIEETIPANVLVLAIGHSARDTFAMIHRSGLRMEQKPFSIGVRMEHPQSLIDASQYGEENVGRLPPADYRLAYKASNGRGVYSFCMCPGGEVVVCTSRDGELCVNGMSNRKRDSGIANSGILCDVRTEDFGSDDVLAGIRFQEKYERLAYINGGSSYDPPRCSMAEFLAEDSSLSEAAAGVIGSLPGFAGEAIREAVPEFARRIHGYDDPQAIVTAVETRSSSPVRILRGDEGESNIVGIYPAGEGAGYAGGITSAACDGIRAAWHIIERFRP